MSEKTEDWFTEKCRDPEFVKAYLAEQQEMYKDDLRAAVAAERERCAEVNEFSVVCPWCKADIGYECVIDSRLPCDKLCHWERWRAAIRKEPDARS